MKNRSDYKSRFRILKGGKIALIISTMMGAVTILSAAPSGESIVSGNISINRDTPNTTNINQTTNKGIINWQNFDVAAHEKVNFNQPNSTSSTLNRVLSNNPSNIYGQINSNGQVFLVNQNGIYFGKNSSVNTAGFTASTLDITNENFLNSNYVFEGTSNASILNLGTINTPNAYTALLAKTVSNEGVIQARLGNVQLASGEKITLDINGNSLVKLTIDKGTLDALVQNKGLIQADGGIVYLTTQALDAVLNGVVNNSGIIEANSVEQKNGKIILFAHGGTAQIDGTLEAKDGFIETSGKSLHVEDTTTIKTAKWLLDPENMIIQSTGGTDLAGESVSATAIVGALDTADIELQATNNIAVNENITWSTDKQLKLSADSINVNATIENTNTTDGGVFFNAVNTRFDATTGKVIIHNINQLQWMNTAINGKYELGSDIDASVTSGWNTSKGWMPIGINSANKFTGTFDGKGHIISNLYINNPLEDELGFFGYVASASIQNVGLENVNISGRNYVGGLVGLNKNISTRTNISNSYVSGSVTGTGEMIGGLVGRSYEGLNITNSYATASVTGNSSVGGLVGDSYINFTGTNSFASGLVTGSTNVGGLIGLAQQPSSTFTNSYYDNETNTGTMGDSATYGKTKAFILTAIGGDGTGIWGIDGSSVEGYVNNKSLPFLKSVTYSLFNSGFGTAENAYTITNWTQLQNINTNTTTLSKHFTLSNNLNNLTTDYTILASATANSGKGWNPIGIADTKEFKGNFDGSGNTISNLTINDSTKEQAGLFGFVNGGVISDIGLVNASIVAELFTGGLVGYNNSGEISNSYVTGSVQGTNNVGGLVGSNSGTITNSYATASVQGANSVGGLVGNNPGTINNSYAAGNVESDGTIISPQLGGLVASNWVLWHIGTKHDMVLKNCLKSL